MMFFNMHLASILVLLGVTSAYVHIDVDVNVGVGEDSEGHEIPTAEPLPRCGIPNREATRIVGGEPTQENEYPWQVLLDKSDDFQTFFCGGSIINEWFILTAAQCDVSLRFQVIVGAHERDNPSSWRQRINVSEVHNHENYNQDTFYNNDIALVKVAEKIIFNEGVSPVCLPQPEVNPDYYYGYTATVIGWGTTEYGTNPEELQEVQVTVVSNELCIEEYGEGSITHNMICAGTEEGGKDACLGDLGGPLLVTESTEEVFTQIGVVSWGNGCGLPDFKGVYARVPRYIGWIQNITSTIYHAN